MSIDRLKKELKASALNNFNNDVRVAFDTLGNRMEMIDDDDFDKAIVEMKLKIHAIIKENENSLLK